MIEKIIETLTPPEAWIKHAYARTAKGRVIGPECKNAACFCLEGAIRHHAQDKQSYGSRFILQAIAELFPKRRGCAEYFNDHPLTTHEDLLRVLRRARELELAAAT